MADADFEINRHDRLPSIQATLSADLTGASSVSFIMRKALSDWAPDFAGAATVNAAATIVDAAGGVCRYDWLAVDTAVAGQYVGQWQVIWTSGSKAQSFPTGSYHTITVFADLDDS